MTGFHSVREINAEFDAGAFSLVNAQAKDIGHRIAA
jgi:hypothetical protein